MQGNTSIRSHSTPHRLLFCRTSSNKQKHLYSSTQSLYFQFKRYSAKKYNGWGSNSILETKISPNSTIKILNYLLKSRESNRLQPSYSKTKIDTTEKANSSNNQNPRSESYNLPLPTTPTPSKRQRKASPTRPSKKTEKSASSAKPSKTSERSTKPPKVNSWIRPKKKTTSCWKSLES